MTRLIAVLAAASALSACTTLSGCGPDANKVAPRAGEGASRVSRDMASQMIDAPFVGRSRWYAVFAYDRGREVVLIGDRADGVDQRLVRFHKGDGYEVSRIRIGCPHGGYSMRDGRVSKSDKSTPSETLAPQPTLQISTDLASICNRTAKVPTFEGNLLMAVRKGRAMNDALDPSIAGAPRAQGEMPKARGEAPPPSQVFYQDRRPSEQPKPKPYDPSGKPKK